MLDKKKKHISSICPKTGKALKPNKKYHWVMWVFPVLGLLSLIWFLIRVIPKPSRVTYPCQRIAAPLASGFVVWLTGIIGSALAYRKAKRFFSQARYIAAGICVTLAVMAIWFSISTTSDNTAKAFTPTDPPNSPFGVAKGIYPGRVVWFHNPRATSWDDSEDSTGNWWDAEYTDQNEVDFMMSKTVQSLAGQQDDSNAWDAIFKHFNQNKGKGNVGYQSLEKIVIKINLNNEGNAIVTDPHAIDALPQMVYSLLDQLVNQAGISQSMITVYDATRPIFHDGPVYSLCHPEFPDVNYVGGSGWPPGSYPEDVVWVANAITYSVGYTDPNPRNLPQCVLDAEYMINMAILKAHGSAPATLCAKNHIGTVKNPRELHDQGYLTTGGGMDVYDLLVDLIGHESIGGKTVLYIIDGLYGANGYGAVPTRWASEPFNNHWPSSIFASQDPVAIDSVGIDFLESEWNLLNNADNYLHEAALANDPCSGTFYDPEDDGTRLESLGVHEHWNNATDKKYSRNLGTGNGIELITPSLTSANGPVENLTTSNKYNHIYFAVDDANNGDVIVLAPGTYTGGGNRDIDFLGKAITIRSTDPNDPNIVASTIIDCSGTESEYHRGFTFKNGEDSNSVLRGLTIINGTGQVEEIGRGSRLVGGAIFCDGTSPTIAQCILETNSADLGGAIFCGQYCNPTITDCSITENTADSEGGGIYNFYYSDPVLINCILSGNSAGSKGGGMYNHRYSEPNLVNCTLTGNTAGSDGGGLYNYSPSEPTLTNCILWANTVGESTNQSTQICGGTPLVNYSCIQGLTGSLSGVCNIDSDPCFVNPGYWATNEIWVEGDYHLLDDSLCINTGDPNYISGLNETDLDGNPRIIDGIIDMGVYEFVPSMELPMKLTPQTLNIDSKGKWIKAHFVMPEGFEVNDVDTNTPATLEPLCITSDHINVSINENGFVAIVAAFERSAFCDSGLSGPTIEVTVTGLLTNGQSFYGTDTIRIISNNFQYLGFLASHWLQTGCDNPDWCNGLDVDRSTTVNFVDFALFDGCCIEITTP